MALQGTNYIGKPLHEKFPSGKDVSTLLDNVFVSLCGHRYSNTDLATFFPQTTVVDYFDKLYNAVLGGDYSTNNMAQYNKLINIGHDLNIYSIHERLHNYFSKNSFRTFMDVFVFAK